MVLHDILNIKQQIHGIGFKLFKVEPFKFQKAEAQSDYRTNVIPELDSQLLVLESEAANAADKL